MSNEESKFPNGFQGIVITGWSRYDHFAVLAELLPASMPSLATNLISVSHGYFNASWQKELYQSLQCADNSRLYEEFIDLESDPTLHEKMSWCFFTGIINFRFLKTETNLKGLYIFRFLFTTSSAKLFVVNAQTSVYNCVFWKKEKLLSQNLSHFENESTFRKKRNTLWK